MNTTVCLACVLISAICLPFILSIGFTIVLIFQKKFQKLDSDLNECFQKLEVILDSLKFREAAKKNFL